jgi:hypothetical protein
MKVNVNKTKIMVFGFGKLRQNLKFTYKNVDIEIVKQFNYLGVIFTKTCNFDVTKKPLRNIEKRKGGIFSPCLTPIAQLKYPVV